MRVVALLRGVNTGGVRFAMRDLAAALTEAGFGNVRTVLASGNVLLDAVSPQAAATGVHDVVLRTFGFDLAVVAVPLAVLRSSAADYPFPRSDDRHAYVVFATHPAVLLELAEEGVGLEPQEQVEPGDGVLYWATPKGRTLETAFSRRLSRRMSAGAITTRNLNTLERIVATG